MIANPTLQELDKQENAQKHALMDLLLKNGNAKQGL
jgi:hypothetical protein